MSISGCGCNYLAEENLDFLLRLDESTVGFCSLSVLLFEAFVRASVLASKKSSEMD